MLNNDFKMKFIESFNYILSNVFTKDKVESYLNEQYKLLNKPIEKHYLRFVSSDITKYNSNYFKQEISRIINFFEYRPNYLNKYIIDLK